MVGQDSSEFLPVRETSKDDEAASAPPPWLSSPGRSPRRTCDAVSFLWPPSAIEDFCSVHLARSEADVYRVALENPAGGGNIIGSILSGSGNPSDGGESSLTGLGEEECAPAFASWPDGWGGANSDSDSDSSNISDEEGFSGAFGGRRVLMAASDEASSDAASSSSAYWTASASASSSSSSSVNASASLHVHTRSARKSRDLLHLEWRNSEEGLAESWDMLDHDDFGPVLAPSTHRPPVPGPPLPRAAVATGAAGSAAAGASGNTSSGAGINGSTGNGAEAANGNRPWFWSQ